MQRELLYGCSSGSGRAMDSSIGCNSADDVGRGGVASAQVSMLYNQCNVQYGVKLEQSPR